MPAWLLEVGGERHREGGDGWAALVVGGGWGWFGCPVWSGGGRVNVLGVCVCFGCVCMCVSNAMGGWFSSPWFTVSQFHTTRNARKHHIPPSSPYRNASLASCTCCSNQHSGIHATTFQPASNSTAALVLTKVIKPPTATGASRRQQRSMRRMTVCVCVWMLCVYIYV